MDFGVTGPVLEPAAADRLEAAGFALLRTPRTPFVDLLQWSELGRGDTATQTTDVTEEREAWILRNEALRVGLVKWLNDWRNREALFLATPGFETVAADRLASPRLKRRRAAERSLVGYLSRAASRPTPFGLFAGTSLLRLGERTHLRLLGAEHDRRTTRIDTGVLEDFSRRITVLPEVRRTLALHPNATVRRVGDRLHYSVVEIASGEARAQTIAIEYSPFLADILEATQGGLEYDALARRLLTLQPETAPEQAAQWIDEMIDTQFLHPDLGPGVTDSAPFGGLLKALTEVLEAPGREFQDPTVRNLATELSILAADLEALDQPGRVPGTADYARIKERFKIPSSGTGNPFHVDLSRPSPEATLSGDLVEEILGAVHWLHRSTPPRRDPLAPLADRFVSRFGEAEVPLSLVFDEEIGIAFDDEWPHGPSALLDDLIEPRPRQGFEDGGLSTALEAHLDSALAKGCSVLTLEDAVFDDSVRADSHSSEPPETRPPLPLTGAVKGTVILSAESPTQFHLHAFMGRPGTSLLGRAALSDPELFEALSAHCRCERELAGHALIAEIVHQPGGAASHLQQRPQLSDWEIVYLGQSRRSADHRIEVDDLRVRIVDGRFYLRSKRLDREVIPRLSAAHDFRRGGLPVYRFLAELQHHGASSWLRWSWGHRNHAPYLPRVTLGRVILARQRWRIDPLELHGWSRLDEGVQRFRSVSHWRGEHQVPRFAFHVDGENETLVDFDNPMMVDAFLSRLPRGEAAVLEEMLESPDRLAAHGPEGHYLHDLILPVTRNRPHSSPRTVPEGNLASTNSQSPSLATDPSGQSGDWIQLNVFCGPITADRILLGPLEPWLSDVTNPATDWFFVRYSDPHHHLRLRLRTAVIGREELSSLVESWKLATENLAIWKTIPGIYKPEIDRYGGQAAMHSAERVFAADSAAVAEILTALPAGTDRWKVALLGIDRLLEDFGLSLFEKRRQMAGLAEAVGEDTWRSKATRSLFSRRFREARSELEALLAGELDSDALFFSSAAALKMRSAVLADSIQDWNRQFVPSRSTGAEHPIQAFVHMHCNRLLTWPSRRQEAVIYQVLLRLYDSSLARRGPLGGAGRSSGFRSSVGRSA